MEEDKVNDRNIHSIIGEYHQAARFLKIIQFYFCFIIVLSPLLVIKVSLMGFNHYLSF